MKLCNKWLEPNVQLTRGYAVHVCIDRDEMHKTIQLQTKQNQRQAEHAIGQTEVCTRDSKSPPRVLHQNDLCASRVNARMFAADADRH